MPTPPKMYSCGCHAVIVSSVVALTKCPHPTQLDVHLNSLGPTYLITFDFATTEKRDAFYDGLVAAIG